jgi:Flp pilus assembly protein TadD
MAVRTSDGLAAAKIATETVTDRPVAWNSYGAALALAGRAGDALAAFDQAVALDPVKPAPTSAGGPRCRPWAGSRMPWPPMTRRSP